MRFILRFVFNVVIDNNKSAELRDVLGMSGVHKIVT
jgi:hypothetical protein